MNQHRSIDNGALPVAATLTEALDIAAQGEAGFHFYSGRGAILESLSFATLRGEAIELARRLLAAGLKRGERVAILAETDANFPKAFFACRYAGLVPAPMPLPAAFGGRDTYLSHLRRMVEAATASAAIAPDALKDWLKDAVDGLDLRFSGTLAELPPADLAAPLAPAAPGDLCYLQFSSGSTRFPVGVAVRESALMANAEAIIRHGLQVEPGDRCVSWLPFYHDMGLVGFMLVPVVAGLSVDYLATRDFARRPLLWLELISRDRGTISYAPSFGYDLCARRAANAMPEGLDLAHWRIAGIGGDMIRPEILTRFVERFSPLRFADDRFVASYGMAETALALSFAPLRRGLLADTLDRRRLELENLASDAGELSDARAFVRCGPALPNHVLDVRDPDGHPLPERRVGRVFARGPSMMDGYFRDPASTEAVLSADGWLDTGDLGYLSEGEIVITGRAKDLIIVNGRNIWPQDLELTAETEVQGLRSGDVAAFSVEGGGEERVVALVECRPSDETLRSHLADEVGRILRSRHGIEVEVVLVKPNSLPLTSSGKLSRTRAREIYRAMRERPAPPLSSV